MDLYRNGIKASQQAKNELARVYAREGKNTVIQNKLNEYAENAISANFHLYETPEEWLELAKKAYENSPAAETKYIWHKLIYNEMLKMGKKQEGFFLKDNGSPTTPRQKREILKIYVQSGITDTIKEISLLEKTPLLEDVKKKRHYRKQKNKREANARYEAEDRRCCQARTGSR